MDNTLVDYLAEEFRKEFGINLKNDRMAMQIGRIYGKWAMGYGL